jgi:hypothetical protein
VTLPLDDLLVCVCHRSQGERVTIALQITDVRGQSMQVYLRDLLEREFRAERNKRIFERLAPHRTLDLGVDDVVEYIRGGREDDR